MKYTILGAKFSNADNTAAVIHTAEAGDVAVSLADTPELWSAAIAFEPMVYISSSKESRIESLQAAYEIDRAKLNQAWLSALIADGAGEAARQALVKSQMEDLDTQLEMDILAIIMEE